MRLVTNKTGIYNWIKFDLKSDTIYHYQFGEWADSTKAKINYIHDDGFQLYYPKDSIIHTFEKIDVEINDETTYGEFWEDFNLRVESANCFKNIE